MARRERKHVWVVEEFRDGIWQPVRVREWVINLPAYHVKHDAQYCASAHPERRTRVRKYVRAD